MASALLCAVRILQVHTVYVWLPLVVLVVFALLAVALGAFYSSGLLRAEIFIGVVFGLGLASTSVVMIAAGTYFFLRVYR